MRQYETSFLYSLLKGDHITRDKLLTHPLVSTYIHLKSRKAEYHLRLFYILIVLYPVFYMWFNYFLYFKMCQYRPPKNTEVTDVCHITWAITISAYVLILLCLVAVGIQLRILCRLDRRHLTSWRTWVTWLGLASMGLTLWPGLTFKTLYNITWQYPIAALGMLFGWIMFLVQIGSYPRFSIYLESLVKILIDVLKVYLLFMPLLIGFYMGFSLMFKEDTSIFGYLIMMVDIGTANYPDIAKKAKENYLWYSIVVYFFCVSFVILIVIVFMNFVLATSVGDMQKLKLEAKVAGISRSIENLFYVDIFLDRCQLFEERHKRFLTISVEHEIPLEILEKLIEIINIKARANNPNNNVSPSAPAENPSDGTQVEYDNRSSLLTPGETVVKM